MASYGFTLLALQFQHMSGTRSPPDFMEVASHLFEHFATDPRVLREFARHRDTGDPIPEDLLDKARKAMAVLPALRLQVDHSEEQTAARQPWHSPAAAAAIPSLMKRLAPRRRTSSTALWTRSSSACRMPRT